MNREIKFRGKDEDTGEWRYGGYHKHQIIEICPVKFDGESEEDKFPKYIHYIIMDGYADWNMEKPILKSNIIAETVGQYTGLKDKNGKEIYEGDIFHCGDTNILYIVVWNDNGFQGKQVKSSSYCGLEYWKNKIEVIGNIYENPELLEENDV